MTPRTRGVRVDQPVPVMNDPIFTPPTAPLVMPEGYVETSRRLDGSVKGEKPEEVELTDKERVDFTNLMSIGTWSKKVDVLGHPVVVQTLCNGDDIRVGMACKDYKGVDLASTRGYQVAVVAAGVVSIDGNPLYSPLSPKESEEHTFAQRVKAVEEMYPLVTTQIYRAIIELDAEYATLTEKLGKSSG